MAFKVFDTDSLKFFTEADKVRKYVGDACKEMKKPACLLLAARIRHQKVGTSIIHGAVGTISRITANWLL